MVSGDVHEKKKHISSFWLGKSGLKQEGPVALWRNDIQHDQSMVLESFGKHDQSFDSHDSIQERKRSYPISILMKNRY
jgi:hypothetical protein